MIPAKAFPTLTLLIVCALTLPAYGADPFDGLVTSLSGTWSCSSVSGGKTTTYTTTYSRLAGTRWLRGINRSGSSQSYDMETYDTKQRVWRIVDMEPGGSMSVLVGSSSNPNHVATRSQYPDATQNVRYDRLASKRYTLTFDFILGGKPAHWVDDCRRR